MADHMTDTSDPGAKERAAHVAGTARDEARGVAGDAKQQASAVASEASRQAKTLIDDAKRAAREQADGQSEKVAGTLGSWSDQLLALAHGQPDQAGDLTAYVDDVGQRVRGMADRIDQRGVEGILDDVQSFARRRPGLFLASAAAVGFAAGRLFRGAGEELGELAEAEEREQQAVGGSREALPPSARQPVAAGPVPGAPGTAQGAPSTPPLGGGLR
ncbi:MAG: hypothetical protein JXA83_01560 [Acidimicrobiales bacterium]|nr:hypothetical protein [Acidimicrobiales bacterium]